MDFLSFDFIDLLDIFLVAILLYQLYRLVQGTVAMNIFIGILAIYFVWKIVQALKMDVLSELLSQFINVGIIALLIVFQPELRRFLLLIGTPEILEKFSFGRKLFGWKSKKKILSADLQAIVKACKEMSETRTGALLILATGSDLNFYIKTGEQMDAKISANTLESIFYKNSPLHDGAVIISGGKIRAARCVLPITEREDFPSNLGMRHRAAAGITENSDALAIIVSEQTGEISFAKGGFLENGISPEKLKQRIESEMA
ncbi:MAG: TIGR00159 family protein [Bacteroidetes bacterium]|nr:TIGR00159 family protein [Bacteroidota bacterium]